MKTAVIIPARMDSKRLPGKHLLMLNGKTVLEHIIYRAKLVEADEVILITPNEEINEPLVKIAIDNGIKVFQNGMHNAELEAIAACEEFSIDAFVNFDGDDPFCDVELMKQSLSLLSTFRNIYHFNNLTVGRFTYAKRVSHMPSQMISNQEWIFVSDPLCDDASIRLTLDYHEDYTFFQAVFKEMNIQENNLSVPDIVRFLRTRPDIVAINSHMKEAWLEHKKVSNG